MAQRERNYAVRSQLARPTGNEALTNHGHRPVLARVSGRISGGSNQDAGSEPLSWVEPEIACKCPKCAGVRLATPLGVMLPLKRFQPEPVQTTSTAPANTDPERALHSLAHRASQVVLDANLGASDLHAAFETLRDVTLAAKGAVSNCARERGSPAIDDAARVASLGLAEASHTLERMGSFSDGLATLRDARQKVYLSIMTVRQTRARVDSLRPPLWTALVPSRSARAALASVRAAFFGERGVEPEEEAWQLFVVASEFDSIRCQPWFGELSSGPRRRMNELTALLSAPTKAEHARERLKRALRILDDTIGELSCHPDQRFGDERMLLTLVHELSERRSEGNLHDSVCALLRSLRGFDRDLDELGALLEDGACPPWALLLQRATDLLAQHFSRTR